MSTTIKIFILYFSQTKLVNENKINIASSSVKIIQYFSLDSLIVIYTIAYSTQHT